MNAEIDLNDLVEMVSAQRNELSHALAVCNAALKGAYKKIMALEEELKKVKPPGR